MAVFAISDLHLALSVDKPMDVFGSRWSNYMDRLETGWRTAVSADDHVLIPGDLSWATYLEKAYEDFKFIESLPGTKIISKGNHDYWWTTMNKLMRFVEDNGFETINFMHNNSYRVNGYAVCGTRGWRMPGDEGFTAEDKKIYDRELLRLEASLSSAGSDPGIKLIAAVHFPVFNTKGVFSEFLDIMLKYNVSKCIYGHLHGDAHKYAFEGNIKGLEMRLVSADYLAFTPLKLI